MSEEFDELDDFESFDDGEFGSDMDFMEPTVVNDRDPVSSRIAQGALDFKDEFALTEEPEKLAKTLISATLPDELKEFTDGGSAILEGIKGKVDEHSGVIKSSLRGISQAVKDFSPDNSIFHDIATKAVGLFSSDENIENQEQSASSLDNEISQTKIMALFGEQLEESTLTENLNAQIASNLQKGSNELLASIASTGENEFTFSMGHTQSYYRRSLELKYKHLFVARQHLKMATGAAQAQTVMLGDIVHNTKLPDFVKAHTSEALIAGARTQLAAEVSKKFFSADGEGWANRAAKRTTNLIDDGVNKLVGVNDMTEMFSGDIAKSSSVHNMVASTAADKLKVMGTNKVKDILSKTKAGRKIIDEAQEAKLDVSDYLESKKGSNKYTDKILSGLIYLTKGNVNEGNYSVESEHGSAPAQLDDLMYATITRTIPAQLAEAISVLKAIESGTYQPKEHFDLSTNTMKSDATVASDFRRKIEKKIDEETYGAQSTLDMSLKQNMSDELYSKFMRSLTKHSFNGKSMSVRGLERNGFYDGMDVDDAKSIKAALKKTNSSAVPGMKGRNELEMTNNFVKIKKGIPDPTKYLKEAVKNGTVSELVKSGIVKYDVDTQQYIMDRDKFIEMVTNHLGKTDLYTANKRSKAKFTGDGGQENKRIADTYDKHLEFMRANRKDDTILSESRASDRTDTLLEWGNIRKSIGSGILALDKDPSEANMKILSDLMYMGDKLGSKLTGSSEGKQIDSELDRLRKKVKDSNSKGNTDKDGYADIELEESLLEDEEYVELIKRKEDLEATLETADNKEQKDKVKAAILENESKIESTKKELGGKLLNTRYEESVIKTYQNNLSNIKLKTVSNKGLFDATMKWDSRFVNTIANFVNRDEIFDKYIREELEGVDIPLDVEVEEKQDVFNDAKSTEAYLKRAKLKAKENIKAERIRTTETIESGDFNVEAELEALKGDIYSNDVTAKLKDASDSAKAIKRIENEDEIIAQIHVSQRKGKLTDSEAIIELSARKAVIAKQHAIEKYLAELMTSTVNKIEALYDDTETTDAQKFNQAIRLYTEAETISHSKGMNEEDSTIIAKRFGLSSLEKYKSKKTGIRLFEDKLSKYNQEIYRRFTDTVRSNSNKLDTELNGATKRSIIDKVMGKQEPLDEQGVEDAKNEFRTNSEFVAKVTNAKNLTDELELKVEGPTTDTFRIKMLELTGESKDTLTKIYNHMSGVEPIVDEHAYDEYPVEEPSRKLTDKEKKDLFFDSLPEMIEDDEPLDVPPKAKTNKEIAKQLLEDLPELPEYDISPTGDTEVGFRNQLLRYSEESTSHLSKIATTLKQLLKDHGFDIGVSEPVEEPVITPVSTDQMFMQTEMDVINDPLRGPPVVKPDFKPNVGTGEIDEIVDVEIKPLANHNGNVDENNRFSYKKALQELTDEDDIPLVTPSETNVKPRGKYESEFSIKIREMANRLKREAANSPKSQKQVDDDNIENGVIMPEYSKDESKLKEFGNSTVELLSEAKGKILQSGLMPTRDDVRIVSMDIVEKIKDTADKIDTKVTNDVVIPAYVKGRTKLDDLSETAYDKAINVKERVMQSEYMPTKDDMRYTALDLRDKVGVAYESTVDDVKEKTEEAYDKLKELFNPLTEHLKVIAKSTSKSLDISEDELDATKKRDKQNVKGGWRDRLKKGKDKLLGGNVDGRGDTKIDVDVNRSFLGGFVSLLGGIIGSPLGTLVMGMGGLALGVEALNNPDGIIGRGLDAVGQFIKDSAITIVSGIWEGMSTTSKFIVGGLGLVMGAKFLSPILSIGSGILGLGKWLLEKTPFFKSDDDKRTDRIVNAIRAMDGDDDHYDMDDKKKGNKRGKGKTGRKGRLSAKRGGKRGIARSLLGSVEAPSKHKMGYWDKLKTGLSNAKKVTAGAASTLYDNATPHLSKAYDATKTFASKHGGKVLSVAKKIPGVAIVAGLASATLEASEGNFKNAGLDVVGAITGNIPWAGAAIGLGLDAMKDEKVEEPRPNPNGLIPIHPDVIPKVDSGIETSSDVSIDTKEPLNDTSKLLKIAKDDSKVPSPSVILPDVVTKVKDEVPEPLLKVETLPDVITKVRDEVDVEVAKVVEPTLMSDTLKSDTYVEVGPKDTPEDTTTKVTTTEPRSGKTLKVLTPEDSAIAMAEATTKKAISELAVLKDNAVKLAESENTARIVDSTFAFVSSKVDEVAEAVAKDNSIIAETLLTVAGTYAAYKLSSKVGGLVGGKTKVLAGLAGAGLAYSGIDDMINPVDGGTYTSTEDTVDKASKTQLLAQSPMAKEMLYSAGAGLAGMYLGSKLGGKSKFKRAAFGIAGGVAGTALIDSDMARGLMGSQKWADQAEKAVDSGEHTSTFDKEMAKLKGKLLTQKGDVTGHVPHDYKSTGTKQLQGLTNGGEMDYSVKLKQIKEHLPWLAQNLGTPYKWGSPTNTKSMDFGFAGYDCSGLTSSFMGRMGIGLNKWNTGTLYRSAHSQFMAPIYDHFMDESKAKPGDIVWFNHPTKTASRKNLKSRHVGIYVGDGWMVHSYGSKGTSLTKVWRTNYKKYFVGFGRFNGKVAKEAIGKFDKRKNDSPKSTRGVEAHIPSEGTPGFVDGVKDAFSGVKGKVSKLIADIKENGLEATGRKIWNERKAALIADGLLEDPDKTSTGNTPMGHRNRAARLAKEARAKIGISDGTSAYLKDRGYTPLSTEATRTDDFLNEVKYVPPKPVDVKVDTIEDEVSTVTPQVKIDKTKEESIVVSVAAPTVNINQDEQVKLLQQMAKELRELNKHNKEKPRIDNQVVSQQPDTPVAKPKPHNPIGDSSGDAKELVSMTRKIYPAS